MTKKLVATLAVLALTLGACATATPYQPSAQGRAASSGGFSDRQLAPGKFIVKFSGNNLTSRETVESYLLYRAAELTLAQGYDRFRMENRQTDRTIRTVQERESLSYRPFFGPGYANWLPSWQVYGHYGWQSWDPLGYGSFGRDGFSERTVQRFEVSAQVIMAKATDAGDSGFDARAVVADLGPRLQRPRS